MTKWILAAVLTLPAFSISAIAESKDALVGTWKLVSAKDTTEKGEVRDSYGSNPTGFMPLFWVALIGNFVLFFVAQNVALKGNNSTALPLLTAYSLLTGFTLSGLVAMAIGTAGIGAIEIGRAHV